MEIRGKNGFFATLTGRVSLLVTLTILIAMAVNWFIVSRDMKAELEIIVTENLRKSVSAFMKVAAEYERLHPGDPEVPLEIIKDWANTLGVRITIIANDGRVLGDSEADEHGTRPMDNHRNRPEIRGALETGTGIDRRYSEMTRVLYLYYAVRTDGGYIVRSAYPLSEYYFLLSNVRKDILVSLIIAGVFAMIAGITGARRITRPIRTLIKASRASRAGDRAVYPTEGTSEIMELSRALSESAITQAKMMDKLANERNQLETIVQNAPCGLMLLDDSRTIIRVNRFFAPLMRNKPRSALGTPADLELRSPELIKIITEAQDGGVCTDSFAYYQSGASTFYQARAVPIGTGDMLLVLNDETERKKMETARKAFVADAGHELQTPLAAISAAAELLAEMDNSDSSEREPFVKEIMRQRERMTVLVDDLLLLSRLESGTPLSKSRRFNFSEMCATLLSDAQKNPLAANISWSVDLSPNEIYFEGRREELGRVVSNLLDNAVKYVGKNFKGRQGGVVSFSLEESKEELVLRVEDNGIGIPQNKLNAIFGRFERVEEDRAREDNKTGGYGLGLAIAKHAAESHGGRIEAQSSEGSTVFAVTLPR